MRVALVQHDIAWQDRDATLGHLEPLVTEAAAGGAGLIVLTELFAVGFTMATDVVAEAPDGPTLTWLRAQSAQHGAWICGSVPEVAPGDERPSNQLMLVGPDGSVHRYAKVHRFALDGEDECYERGATEITVDLDGLRVTPFVCYDLRFADRFWDRAAASDCYVVVASWPAARREHWRTLLRARAIENQAYVLGCSRVGEGGGVEHAGDSMVIDPFGEVLVDGEGRGEAVLFADVDPERVVEVREAYPFLRDRT